MELQPGPNFPEIRRTEENEDRLDTEKLAEAAQTGEGREAFLQSLTNRLQSKWQKYDELEKEHT
eukprot:10108094-Lingulodinium_polyedra.AAC.1